MRITKQNTILKTYLQWYLKQDSTAISIYINKIEKGITFKERTRCSREVTAKIKKLLEAGNQKSLWIKKESMFLSKVSQILLSSIAI